MDVLPARRVVSRLPRGKRAPETCKCSRKKCARCADIELVLNLFAYAEFYSVEIRVFQPALSSVLWLRVWSMRFTDVILRADGSDSESKYTRCMPTTYCQ